MPIFQGPDEDLHADYVFCLYSQKKLIQQNPSHKVTLAHSFSRYLLSITDTQAIKFNPFVKVPYQYGSKAFFKNMDLRAPKAEIFGCPILVGTNPAGFYLLNALWLLLISNWSSSLTVLFFAARFLSVFLFAIGLIFSYFTLRELGLLQQKAYLLLLAIGLLPLSSFNSSYIQPHNLSFAAISACFYFALRWRNTKSIKSLWSLSIALAILFLAKYQFYFCTALAAVLMILTKNLVRRDRLPERLKQLFLLLSPSLFSLLIQSWIHNGTWYYPASTETIQQNIKLGIPQLLRQFYNSSYSLVQSLYFANGYSYKSFWGWFGWTDTPLIIVDNRITDIINMVIQCLNFGVLLFTILSLTHIWRVILKALKRGHFSLGYYLAFSNPVISSYFFFFTLVFVVAFISIDKFSLQGRHWFSLVLPIFWTTCILAPRFLPNKTLRNRWFFFVLTLLLLYSIVGNIFAIGCIKTRYYQKTLVPISISKAKSLTIDNYCKVEKFDYIPQFQDFTEQHKLPLSVPQGCPLVIRGRAIDSPHNYLAAGVFALVDDKKYFQAMYGLESPSAIEELNNKAFKYSGFAIVVPTAGMNIGEHFIDLKTLSIDRNFLYNTSQKLQFDIKESNLQQQRINLLPYK